jgi:hypothetical protein
MLPESIYSKSKVVNDSISEPPDRDFLYKIIAQATKAVPFVKYALGLSGILALISMVSAYGLSLKVAAWGVIIILVLMTILFLLARASKDDSISKWPAQVLLWAIVLAFTLTMFSLITSIFFKYPLDLRKWLDPDRTITHNESSPKQDPEIQTRRVDTPNISNKRKAPQPESILPKKDKPLTISIQLNSETEGYKEIYYRGTKINPLPESTPFNPRISITSPGGTVIIITCHGDSCFTSLPEILDSSITRITPNCNFK